MSYLTREMIQSLIPPDDLLRALDDQGAGVESAGAWEIVCNGVDAMIDAPLSRRYVTPVAAPLPPVIRQAAVIFGAYLLFARRRAENPYEKAKEAMEARLAEIGNGALPLDVSLPLPSSLMDAITEPATSHSTTGRLPC